ncbi:MAG: hypothetical protein MR434_06595, partial [Ruminococcus sp.]|nr:hypothetical protein [Ruminococcus sp.]
MLVKSRGVELVHGTDNGKKTGCGINLVKEGSRYEQIGAMSDICQISCEKCKYTIAKKMIKADKKDRARMMKEEKMREKMGIADEGIVPLGNTQAKITQAPRQQKQEEPKPAAPKPAVQEKPVQPEPAPAPAAEAPVQEAPKTIPGTGIAFDDDLAQFAINVPQTQEEPDPAPAPVQPAPKTIPGTGIAIDDDLAQFAINAPAPEQDETQPKAAPLQDDFLAQFAIPSPVSQPVPEAPSAEPAPSEVYETAPAEETAEPEELSDDDLVKLFSVSSDSSTEESHYVNDENVVDISENEISAVTDDADELPSAEDSMSQWESVANQLFGYSEPENEQEAPAADTSSASGISDSDYMSDLSVPETAPAAEEAASVSAETATEFMSDLSVPEAPVAEETVPDFMSDLSVP